jgi:hypothetical protein
LQGPKPNILAENQNYDVKITTKYLQASCIYAPEAEKERINTELFKQHKVSAPSITYFVFLKRDFMLFYTGIDNF